MTPEGSDLASVDMLNEVRVGLNILQLRSARHGLPQPSVDAVDAILREVAAYYRSRLHRSVRCLGRNLCVIVWMFPWRAWAKCRPARIAMKRCWG